MLIQVAVLLSLMKVDSLSFDRLFQDHSGIRDAVYLKEKEQKKKFIKVCSKFIYLQRDLSPCSLPLCKSSTNCFSLPGLYMSSNFGKRYM